LALESRRATQREIMPRHETCSRTPYRTSWVAGQSPGRGGGGGCGGGWRGWMGSDDREARGRAAAART